MSFSLKSKTALVTGSTDGLGKTIALELASHGAHVIVHGRDSSKVETTLSEIKKINPSGEHKGIVCDLINPKDIEEKFSEVTAVDILINNAGVWLEGDTTEATSEKILELLNVNLGAPLLLAHKLLPILVKSEFGQILNVSSIAGVEIPVGYYHTVYSATKFGVQAFSEALAKEFENKNLRVMGYYPGGMETNIFKKAGIDYKAHEPWMFDPKESAEAILFMLTRDSKVNVKRMDLINHLQQ
jgi:short-subunit dehydrogenase